MATEGIETETIMAGETLSAALEFADYPVAVGATLRYHFRAGAMRTEHDATASGTEWTLAVPASDSIRWEPGDCFYSGLYTDADGTVTEIDSGCIVVRQNPMVRSQAERTYNAICAVMEGRAESDQLTVTLGDVSLQYMMPAELARWRAHFGSLVQAERNRMRRDRGLDSRNRIGTRFEA